MAGQYKYKYGPLLPSRDSIRLLKLDPRKQESDPLTGTLEVIRLSLVKVPEYTALSWVWGREAPTVTIPCSNNKNNKGGGIKVTRNLFNALQNLESLGHRALWVDSICINQDDIKERASQVALLAQIYESAKTVIVWLGEDHPATDIDAHDGTTLTGPPSWESKTSPKVPSPDSDSLLLSYLQRPWFSRGWTLQEMMLAPSVSVLLEHQELKWDAFWDRTLVELSQSVCSSIGFDGQIEIPAFAELPLQLYTLVSTAKVIPFLRKQSVPKRNLVDISLHEAAAIELANILNYYRATWATDPRDQVYALMGLVEPLGIEIPTPDYSQTVEAVFREAGLALFKTGKGGWGDVRLTNKPKASNSFEGCLFNNRPFVAPSGLQPRVIPMRGTRLTQASLCSLSKSCHGSQSEYGGEDSVSETEASETTVDVPEPNHDSFFADVLKFNKAFIQQQVLTQLGSGPGMSSSTVPTSGEGGSSKTGKGQVLQRAKEPRGVRRRKRGDEDEDEDERLPKRMADTAGSSDPRDLLACPYFQRDSHGPRLSSACRGPGWPTVARLKEHLYRVHRIYPCDRCGTILRDRPGLVEHLRSDEACGMRDWRLSFDPGEGFEDPQYESLKRRKISEWNQIFRILFPGDDETGYPPQHYQASQFIQIFDEFCHHYHLECARLLPQRLANRPSLQAISQASSSDEFCRRVSALVNDLHNEIVRSYRRDLLRSRVDVEPNLQQPAGVADPTLWLAQSAAAPAPHLPPARYLPPASAPAAHMPLPVSGTATTPDVNMAWFAYLRDFAPEGSLDDLDFGELQSSAANVEETWSWLEPEAEGVVSVE